MCLVKFAILKRIILPALPRESWEWQVAFGRYIWYDRRYSIFFYRPGFQIKTPNENKNTRAVDGYISFEALKKLFDSLTETGWDRDRHDISVKRNDNEIILEIIETAPKQTDWLPRIIYISGALNLMVDRSGGAGQSLENSKSANLLKSSLIMFFGSSGNRVGKMPSYLYLRKTTS